MRLREFSGSYANNSTSRPQPNQDRNQYRNQEKSSMTEGQKLAQRDVGGFKSKALDEQRQLKKYFQSLKAQIANLEEEMIKVIEVNHHEQMITAQKIKNKNLTEDTFSETNDMIMDSDEKMQRNATKIEGQINKILKNLRAKLLGKNEHRKNDRHRHQPKYNKDQETRRPNRFNNRQQKDRNRQKKTVDEENVSEKSQRSFKQIGDPILLRNAPKEGHFSLKIKIEEVIRVLEGKEGPRLLIKVSDSSGSGEFVAGRSPLLLEGNIILVTNCFVFYHTGKNKITKKQISMRKNGTITVVKEEADKRGKIEDISQSKFFRKEIKQTVTQINDIEPGEQGYFLKAKVYKILNRNKNKIKCMLGDESGMVNAELPQKEIIRQGEILELRSINAEVIKERILMTTSANSTITLSKGEIVRLRLDNDISMRLYEEDDS